MPSSKSSSPAIVVVVSNEPDLAGRITCHLGTRAEVRTCVNTSQAEAVLNIAAVDVLVCQDTLPGETGIMFLSRYKMANPWMRRVLVCGQLENDLLLRIINEVQVFACVIEPCTDADLNRQVDSALSDALATRALFNARRDPPGRLVLLWIQALPRLAFLTFITCGGVLLTGLATLILLYLLKSLAGIDLFADAHLSSLWR